MSCITELLRLKGDREYLVKDDIAIEDGGIYKGYEYLVTFVSTFHRCGYVAISKEHPLYDVDLMSYSGDGIDLYVHGGVTFNESGKHVINRFIGDFNCDDKWIGFDAMHFLDLEDYESTFKIFKYNDELIKTAQQVKEVFERCRIYDKNIRTIKDKNYMVYECKRLINQLITHEKGIKYDSQGQEIRDQQSKRNI